LQTQKMFIAQVTVLHATPNDFHDYPINGKMMPKGYHVDRIGEAAGVEFIPEHCGTRKEGENVWVGFAQGKRRMGDGTYRSSSKQDYEFDVDTRAEEDFLNDKKGKYKTETDKRKHFLELKKFARQRASSGARLRVIRELVGIPIAFGKEDFQRAMLVSRIAVNTDEMLGDPEMRQAAIDHAVGAQGKLFGPPKDVTPPAEALPEPEGEEAPEDDWDEPDQGTELSEIDKARIKLEEWALSPIIEGSPKALAEIKDLLANEKATLDQLDAMIARCESYQNRKEGKAS